MRLLGFDTERIIVPFSLKSMNHMAYITHVVTDVWCVRVCYCLSNSYAIVIRHSRRFNNHAAIQFRDRQKPHPLNSRRAVRRRHYRPRMKSQKTTRSVNMLNHVPTISVLSATSDLQSHKLSPRWSLAQWSAVAWTKKILFIGVSISFLHKLEWIQNTLARVVTR